MTGQELAALIVAITGAVAAIFAGVRNLRSDKFRKDVEASASLLSGYTTMVTTLQAEINRAKADARRDRETCDELRERLRDEYHADLARLRAEHREELRLAYERIDDLSEQVYRLQHRTEETYTRRDDPHEPA